MRFNVYHDIQHYNATLNCFVQNENIILIASFLGYASNCRHSREEEQKRLQEDIIKLNDEFKKYPPLEHVQQEYFFYMRLRQMEKSMNLSDSDSDDSDIPVMHDTKEQSKYEDYEYSSSDDDNYENDD